MRVTSRIKSNCFVERVAEGETAHRSGLLIRQTDTDRVLAQQSHLLTEIEPFFQRQADGANLIQQFIGGPVDQAYVAGQFARPWAGLLLQAQRQGEEFETEL